MNELLTRIVGPKRCDQLLAQVAVPPQLAALQGLPTPVPSTSNDPQPRAAVAMVMSLVLFEDLLARVPSGARYVASQRERGRQVVFDHGAVRTVDWPETGHLPPGAELFRRLLIPLGYREVGRYPLDRIHMTGWVFTHADLPEQVPQYFVSELHVVRLDPDARQAVTRTVGDSENPLDSEVLALLDELAGRGWMALDDAARLIPMLASCFGRHHPDPRLDDYHTLLRHSAEMAWIATEGNAFNHATDRVPDVEALAESLRQPLKNGWPPEDAIGWSLKDTVERSRSGRVRQTALRADPVVRRFRDAAGASIAREVPGSFFEFITRDLRPDGKLDLTFDAGNAQGIFHMTTHPPVGTPSSTTNPDPERL
ncbi:MAG: 2-oxoadipate dioxygenase/decarboxylase family protein [Pseudonocardiaceae bacterium]